jgi:hypothetical protein
VYIEAPSPATLGYASTDVPRMCANYVPGMFGQFPGKFQARSSISTDLERKM